jgi:biopolymer transport protein ExbD
MTSMIDVFVVLTVFLLITFSTSSEGHSSHDVPMARNVEEIVDAPMIDVRTDGTYLDGVKMHSREELVTHLKAKRDLAKQLAPNKPPNDHVILAIDPDVPSGVVKATVKAAADGGFPSLDFMVQKG